MNKGTRVRLLRDHTDDEYRVFTAGQTGSVAGSTRAGDVIVDFDGYDAERVEAKSFREAFKNATIVEKWIGHIPADALEVTEAVPVRLDDEQLSKMLERAQAARNEVYALCNGKRWTMSVPARSDDSDLCIHTALADNDKLIAEVRELRAALEQIANREDSEMVTARTLHYDMRGWARRALKIDIR